MILVLGPKLTIPLNGLNLNDFSFRTKADSNDSNDLSFRIKVDEINLVIELLKNMLMISNETTKYQIYDLWELN
jgi:hypothetical protein